MISIYKIINNVNGKVYIGKTSKSIKQRLKDHINSINTKSNKVRPLYDAMIKYGIENFNIELIEKVENNDMANQRESYWINEYNSYIGFKNSNGYNATLGGDGFCLYDHEKIASTYLELESVKETAQIYNCSEEFIRSICKEFNIEIILEERIIYQIHYHTEEIVNVFNRLSDILIEYPEYNLASIDGSMLNHTLYMGYIWIHKSDYSENTIKEIKQQIENGYKKKYVNGKLIHTKYNLDAIYNDLKETCNFDLTFENFHIDKETSVNWIKSRLFEFYGKDNVLSLLKTEKIAQLDLDENIINIFNNRKEANVYLGKSQKNSNISAALNKDNKTAYGFKWKTILI